jgi:hypothetical protein
MNIQSIVLLALIMIWLVAALMRIVRKGMCGCGGGCDCSQNCCKSCGRDCAKCKKTGE